MIYIEEHRLRDAISHYENALEGVRSDGGDDEAECLLEGFIVALNAVGNWPLDDKDSPTAELHRQYVSEILHGEFVRK